MQSSEGGESTSDRAQLLQGTGELSSQVEEAGSMSDFTMSYNVLIGVALFRWPVFGTGFREA